jgi:hypothetical protein
LVTGRHTVSVEHTTTATTDRGYLVFTNANATCGGTSITDPNGDVFRSYFRIPANLPINTGFPAYEMTLFTQATFNVAAGGGTFTVFLNGVMLSGASANDAEGNDQVHIEFHVQ